MKPVALIIDDEGQMRRLLRLVLEGESYQVHEVETAQQGLTEIAGRRPDVILLDLGLPDMDGLEALKRLHGNTIHLPTRAKDLSDRDRLALRFERFVAAR